MFRFLAIVASVVAAAHAFGDGAPPSVDICNNLTPKHGAEPQTKASPFSISIDKESILPGDHVQVTLQSLNESDKFKGFLVQAQSDKDKIVGTFQVEATDANVQTINCPGGEKNAVTHRNPEEKSKIQINWVAPNDLSGTVVFEATFVKEGQIFWVAQTSSKLTVGH